MSKNNTERIKVVINDLSSDLEQTAGKFLKDVVKEIAALSMQYYNKIDEFPFIYAERQFQSVLLPAMVKVADAVLAEQPVPRRIKGEVYSGRIDYWVYYRDLVFLMEVKHGWIASQLRKSTRQKWKTQLGQLRSITKKEARELGMDAGKVCKIALLVVPCYRLSQDEEKVVESVPTHKQVFELHRQFENLTPLPNWSAVWSFPNEEYVFDYVGGYHIFPCVNFVAKIDIV